MRWGGGGGGGGVHLEHNSGNLVFHETGSCDYCRCDEADG